MGEAPAGHQSVVVPGVRVAIDTSGAIDVPAERARLGKLLDAALNEIKAADARLAKPEFVAKASQQAIDKITDRLAKAEADVTRITAQLDGMPTA